MTAESYLGSKLQKFSSVDLSLVKWAYLILGLMIGALYPKLYTLNWVFYLVVALFCYVPLYVHFFSQSGTMQDKIVAYLKTNNPSNQVLLLVGMVFFALFLGVLIPIITQAAWWVYFVIILLMAAKPIHTVWFT